MQRDKCSFPFCNPAERQIFLLSGFAVICNAATQALYTHLRRVFFTFCVSVCSSPRWIICIIIVKALHSAYSMTTHLFYIGLVFLAIAATFDAESPCTVFLSFGLFDACLSAKTRTMCVAVGGIARD